MRSQKVYTVCEKAGNLPVLKQILNAKLFLYFYLVVCLLQSVPTISPFLSPVSKLCFLWGAGLLLWDLVYTRRLFRMTYWALPLLFLGVFGFSVLANAREALAESCKHIIHCAIFMVLVYEVFADASRQEILRSVRTVSFILITVLLILSTVSLVLFSLDFSTIVDGHKVGLFENRLYGIYASPNPGALLSLMASIASVILLFGFDSVGRGERILHIGNIVIQTVFFSLTLSKAGDLALCTFAVAFAVFYGIPRMSKRMKLWKAILLVTLCVVLILLLISGVMELIRLGMAEVPSLLNQNSNHDIHFDRVETGDDISNNRFTIWKACLKLFPEKPLFGYGDLNVDTAPERFPMDTLTQTESYWLIRIEGYTHNAFLQALMYAGIAGLLVFLMLAVCTVFHVVRILIVGNKKALEYEVIAVLFSAAAMLTVNGMVESHLLFNRQDPIGLVFWFLLGASVCLANDFRNSSDYLPDRSEAEFAMVAATPLQLLHCAEFVSNNVDGAAGNTDLYIVHTFPTAPVLSDGARNSGLYRNVYDLKPHKAAGAIGNKLHTFADLFFPRAALSARSCGEPLQLNRKVYRVVCASSQTTFTIGMHLVYPKAKIYLYDDGIGSYYGSMVHDYNSPLFQRMNSLFFAGKLIMEPEAMYLAVPELSRSTSCGAYRKLPGLDAEGMLLAERMFCYRPNDLYRNHRLVYLTQPFGESSKVDLSAEPGVLSLMEKYAFDAVARVHPRQKEANFGVLARDTYENLWEMECLKQITDDHILVSYCSTAQFMPKLMNDKEPHLVFLYRIFGLAPSAQLQTLMQEFRALYRNPERIHVPEDLSQLETILKEMIH